MRISPPYTKIPLPPGDFPLKIRKKLHARVRALLTAAAERKTKKKRENGADNPHLGSRLPRARNISIHRIRSPDGRTTCAAALLKLPRGEYIPPRSSSIAPLFSERVRRARTRTSASAGLISRPWRGKSRGARWWWEIMCGGGPWEMGAWTRRAETGKVCVGLRVLCSSLGELSVSGKSNRCK